MFLIDGGADVATKLLDLVESQLIANRLPLVAVSLAAVPHANTPTVLTLHWHGFVEVKLAEEGDAVAYQSVPSSALQVNMRWDQFDDIEFDALETAWELGAWNLERLEAKPFGRVGALTYETNMGMTAFGISAIDIDGEATFVADVPEGSDLIDAASRAGYIQWTFRPVRGGMWSEVADDETLEPGGYRNPTCPLTTQPVLETYRLRTPRRLVYPFGRSRKLVQ
ncbi:MAG TPA: diguanylate cyclase [Betaproteobacteria bacterium]|nr:diguanylate cyclase [Betaproteobacteria bacterium]